LRRLSASRCEDAEGALALRADAEAIALRGIAMAQIGDVARAGRGWTNGERG
jgi:hypothetical protein